MISLSTLFRCAVFLNSVLPCRTVSTQQHTDVILIGATGDLAGKYLWQGIFRAYQLATHRTFTFHGCARNEQESGEAVLSDKLRNCLKCADKICEQQKADFMAAVRYCQLRSDEDFVKLAEVIAARGQYLARNSVTSGRVFYMSIPPSAYLTTARLVHQHCRPLPGGKSWLRLVLEKPFGRDSTSAAFMATQLLEWFDEEEIFRVDHYLQKSVVKQILPFRYDNREWLERLLNKDHVERVEVVMKEPIGVKGRIGFYNENGIIRDVFQNHLTELLSLVTMDLPDTLHSSKIQKNKLRLLHQVKNVNKNQMLTGQYHGYMLEASEEGINQTMSIKTPTFATVQLSVNSFRWRSVAFMLVSGKNLGEKASYIRIIFKNNKFCFVQIEDCSKMNQIIFHIGHGSATTPSIWVSKSFTKVNWPDGVQEAWGLMVPQVNGAENLSFHVAVPKSETDAYVHVIADILEGNRENFVQTSHLLAMWNIWTPVVQEADAVKPRLYFKGASDPGLDFIITVDKLEFLNEMALPENPQESCTGENSKLAQIPNEFLGGTLNINSTDFITVKLAQFIAASAKKRIEQTNSFHIAFSGGTSPRKLFRQLLLEYPPSLWTQTSIWLVDERCVPLDHERSNFNLLYTELLSYINVPFVNVHPMSVDFAGRLCDSKDQGDKLYEDFLTNKTNGKGLDFVLLGMGSDGHTASLFPHQHFLRTTKRKVLLTDGPSPSDQRMTLTIKAINMSREVAVFVTGKSKHAILHSIQSGDQNISKYPITWLNKTCGLSWYVDFDAWLN